MIEAERSSSQSMPASEETGFATLSQVNTATSIGSVAGFEGVSLADCARPFYSAMASVERQCL
jgi:hypothetical protein